MTTFDVFLYNGEPIADARMSYLYGRVDYFVVVEATHTFRGRPKETYAERQPWANRDNVFLVLVDDMPSDDPWTNERRQRNAGVEGLRALGAEPDDLVLFSDVDEIPNLSTVLADPIDTPAVLDQTFYYYNFRWRKPTRWRNASVCRFGHLGDGHTPQNMRGSMALPTLPNAGWHLSYAVGADGIREKLESFSHAEYDLPRFKTDEHIRRCFEEGIDLFGRPGEDCLDDGTPDLPSALQQFHYDICRAQGVKP